jgi:hypothetical protein
VKVVRERLGHASVAFALQVYSAWIPSMQTTASKAMAGFVRQNRARERGLGCQGC